MPNPKADRLKALAKRYAKNYGLGVKGSRAWADLVAAIDEVFPPDLTGPPFTRWDDWGPDPFTPQEEVPRDGEQSR